MHHQRRHRLKSWPDLWFGDAPPKHVVVKMQHLGDQTLALDRPPAAPAAADLTARLSDELLLRILAALPDHLRGPSSLVSKRWLRLAGRLRRSLTLLEWRFLHRRLALRFPDLTDLDLVPASFSSSSASTSAAVLNRGPVSVPSSPTPTLPSATAASSPGRHRPWSRRCRAELPRSPQALRRRPNRLPVGPHRRRRWLPHSSGAGAPPMHRSRPPPHLRIQQPPDPPPCRLRRGFLRWARGHRHRPHHPRPWMQAPRQARARRVRGELRRDLRNRAVLRDARGAHDLRPPDGRRVARRALLLRKPQDAEAGGCRRIDTDPGPIEHLGSCAAIERLQMQRCQLRDRRSLHALFVVCEAAREIVFENCWGLDNEMFSSASICRRVKLLSLEGCSLLTTEGLESVILTWKDLQNLIVVSCNNIKNNEVSPALSSLFSDLKELKWRPDTKSLLAMSLAGTGMGKKGGRFFKRRIMPGQQRLKGKAEEDSSK
uniref:F-box domain-containing protein n=1 Tax=Ananas comosus var. bracteatus TaxID=296719 RepID=A0A6V7QQ33_ANACO|nr:unnamed protein product [Ananas comosus var. bracteatus]